MGDHLACWYVSMGVYIQEAQGLMKVNSATLDLVGSNQFSYVSFLTKSIYPTNYDPILENPDHV